MQNTRKKRTKISKAIKQFELFFLVNEALKHYLISIKNHVFIYKFYFNDILH